MNLYGEYANVEILKLCLQAKGYSVSIERKFFKNNINFLDSDFVYMGSGLESNQKCALSILKRYKAEIFNSINSDKVFLFTGNSFEIFSEKIVSRETNYSGLGIFDFNVQEKFSERITSDVIFKSKELSSTVVGFINKCSEVFGIKNNFFEVIKGMGDNKKHKKEGIIFKNFFGTSLIGPLLVKNPDLLEKISNLLIKTSSAKSNDAEDDKNTSKVLFEKIKIYLKKSFELTLKKLSKT
jgi:CobQ-like glutamine amidotransferase family enzyme